MVGNPAAAPHARWPWWGRAAVAAARGNGGMMGSHKNASLDQTSYNVAAAAIAASSSSLFTGGERRENRRNMTEMTMGAGGRDPSSCLRGHFLDKLLIRSRVDPRRHAAAGHKMRPETSTEQNVTCPPLDENRGLSTPDIPTHAILGSILLCSAARCFTRGLFF